MEQNYNKSLSEILESGVYNQASLAEKLNVTPAALNRWVKGNAKPHPKRIVAINKLHKEIVGYKKFTSEYIAELINSAETLKQKNIWDFIAGNEDLQNELLLEHTYNSTSIEGTTFTKRETESVIFNGIIVKDKTLKEHLEVTNHAAILRNIFETPTVKALSEEFIKSLHAKLMQGLHNNAGNYSVYERVIRGLEIALTHPSDIPEEMNHLISAWNEGLSTKTIKDIAEFHIAFELIHPFGDGNGRLGRLIMIIQCLGYGFPPVIIENARKTDYYDVLEYAQTTAMSGPFIEFIVEEMLQTNVKMKKYQK
ncbi:MAG: Fic family protein [Candidatus Omnitrophica bacterium]|nr:Fic family protein [Candidatus Omnitrophota bacterium]